MGKWNKRTKRAGKQVRVREQVNELLAHGDQLLAHGEILIEQSNKKQKTTVGTGSVGKPPVPEALVAFILRGFKAQVEYDKTVNSMGISAVGLDIGYNVDTETREMLHLPEYESIFDDVTGVQLPSRKEIEFLLGFPV